jgi:hypothetical protein
MRAVVDWSYNLLTEDERLVFRMLGIFAGDFTVEAAAAVSADAAHALRDTVDRLADLVAKSLVVADVSGARPRFRLLDTTRAYAIEKLEESGERERIARRHAEYYRNLFQHAPEQPTSQWLADQAREIDNVRAALDWSLDQARDPTLAVVLTAAYVPVWFSLSLLAECRERTEAAVTNVRHVSDLAALRMQLHLGLGISLYFTMEQVDTTITVLMTALQLAEDLDDWGVQLQVLWILWNMHFSISECHAAQPAAERVSLKLQSGAATRARLSSASD